MGGKIAAVAILLTAASSFLAAQQSGSPTRDVTCTFADGKGMRIQYNPTEKASKSGLPEGKPWSPAEKPFSLFLDTPVTVGGSTVPIGAYSLFVIPGKADWTLVVNKDVGVGKKRKEADDIAKTKMQTGELGQGETNATVYLAHISPTQCNVRIVYGKTMAWGEIHEQPATP